MTKQSKTKCRSRVERGREEGRKRERGEKIQRKLVIHMFFHGPHFVIAYVGSGCSVETISYFCPQQCHIAHCEQREGKGAREERRKGKRDGNRKER